MWFNGTELTDKAQRALRHEQVTIVAHHTGYIHLVYPDATIQPAAYERFRHRLRAFLRQDLNMERLANYLRQNSKLQRCFQIMHIYGGKPRYIQAERVYSYEHSSSYRVSDATRDKLLEEIDEDEFYPQMIDGRIPLNKFEDFFRLNRIDLDNPADVERLAREFTCYNAHARNIVADLTRFLRLEPRLPDAGRELNYVAAPPIEITPAMSREDIVQYLETLRGRLPTADLAFYALRDFARTDWAPFIKAALERNPVSINGARDLTDDQVAERLAGLPNESIYDGARMAQPDEVWNFGRGDGFERALCLANIWRARRPEEALEIESRAGQVELRAGARRWGWPTCKGLTGTRQLPAAVTR
jgi:hypothetical protein